MKFSGETCTVTDGPFAEAKEVVAGFTIFQVASLAEAIEWVKRAPRLSAADSVIEIRKLMDVEDFGDFFVAVLLEVKEGEGGAEGHIEFAKKLQRPLAVHLAFGVVFLGTNAARHGLGQLLVRLALRFPRVG